MTRVGGSFLLGSVVTAVLTAGGCGSGSPPSAAGASATSTPTPSPSPTIAASCVAGDPAHVRHFPSADHSEQVEAYTEGTGPVGVVLAHQVGADLCQWFPMMGDFTAKGYRVMAVSLGSHIDSDVAAAAADLRAQGARKVFLIGASMGGTAVLAAAGEVTPPVQGVVSLSGPDVFDAADAMSAVKTFTVPVAYIAGALDHEFADDAQRMYAATTEKAKTIHLLPDLSLHGVDLWSEVSPEVFAFIAKYAG